MSAPDAPRPLAEEEILEALRELPDWQLQAGKLRTEYRFADFLTAMAFMQTVAPVAEVQNHHPEWSNVYDRVRIELVTHDAAPPQGAVSERDLRLAREISRLAALHRP